MSHSLGIMVPRAGSFGSRVNRRLRSAFVAVTHCGDHGLAKFAVVWGGVLVGGSAWWPPSVFWRNWKLCGVINHGHAALVRLAVLVVCSCASSLSRLCYKSSLDRFCTCIVSGCLSTWNVVRSLLLCVCGSCPWAVLVVLLSCLKVVGSCVIGS